MSEEDNRQDSSSESPASETTEPSRDSVSSSTFTPSEGQPSAPSHGHSHPWRWPITLMVFGILAFGAYWITVNETTSIFKSGAKQATRIKDSVVQAADSFESQNIAQSFLSQLPAKIEHGGDQLEIASFEAVESFRSESRRKVAWDVIDLGTTVSEIRVPVTFRYHVLLSDDWKLEVHNNICFVLAPEIRPTQPPAIHTDRMETFSTRGWARFDSDESMDQLVRTITPTVMEYAGDEKHKALVKDTARKGVATFVRNWLLDQQFWNTNAISRIIVTFNDEETLEFHPSDLKEKSEVQRL